IVAAVNILMVFVISIVVIPIFYSFSKPPKKRHYNHLDKNWVSGFTKVLTFLVEKRRVAVYITVSAIAAVAIFGAFQIKMTGNLTEEYQDDDPLLIDLKYLENKFGGSV